MADGEHAKEFPDVVQKLAAPKKLSAFEKDRLAQQAKEKRAEAENAAALKAFRDSFAEEDDDDHYSQFDSREDLPSGPRGTGLGYGGLEARYGMPSAGPRSGPGSLGAPPSLKRKRALDEMREAQEARREQLELEGYDDARSDSRGTPQPTTEHDDAQLDAPRLTVQLSSLPPGMSTEEIKVLLRDHLSVHSVRLVYPSGSEQESKRSVSAIVTLTSETSTSQIEAAVSALRDHYLSCGFYLSISRHLSSAALHPSLAPTNAARSTEPFGAEKSREGNERFAMRNAPPPDQRGFAPPDSYESYDNHPRPRYGENLQSDPSVNVRPPLDIATVRAVHAVVDQLLLEPDPERALEIEAMLMARPDVQKDERFAFLFDSKSPAGVYYRFLLWAPEDQEEAIMQIKRSARGSERIHKDLSIDWMTPYQHVPFPDLKALGEVITDMDYVSSDEESDDDGRGRHGQPDREGDVLAEGGAKKHMTPLQNARFTHMLSRLPTAIALLRKGDTARVTYFAINHASQDAEGIVDTLLLNIMRPFSYSLASKYEESDNDQDEEDVYEPDEHLSDLESTPAPDAKDDKRDDDPSNAKLIALYLISDILSASSTAGARNAWKYRQLFENGFKVQRTFEHLGKLDKELGWGRLKAEQWKRKVGVIFGIWEGWSVFSADVLEELKKSFFEPPLSEEEIAAAQAEVEKDEKRKQEDKLLAKFKRVGQNGSPAGSISPAPESGTVAKKDKPQTTLMQDPSSDVEMRDSPAGTAVLRDDVEKALPLSGFDGASEEKPSPVPNVGMSLTASKTAPPANGKLTGPRRRMKAEDMFGDSDDE